MQSPDFNTNTIQLLAKLYIWRKKLIIITALAAIISTVASFLIAPQYKATAVVFPSRTFSVSKLLIEQNIGGQEDYMEIGDDDDAEKLLQILNSIEIRQRVADIYDLWTYWKIDKNSPYADHYLKLKWDDMVSFKHTNYMSIRIDVFDYESSRAANIANSIVQYADTVKFNMSRKVSGQALKIVKAEYLSTVKNIHELEDSLHEIQKLGILNYKVEVKAYAKSMAKAVAKGDQGAINNLKVKMDLLEKYGLKYDDLFDKLKKYRFKFPVIKEKYDDALVNYNEPLPSNFLVEKAIRNEKKAKPVRFVIVALSTISAFLIALFYLLFIDKLIEIKKKIVNPQLPTH